MTMAPSVVDQFRRGRSDACAAGGTDGLRQRPRSKLSYQLLCRLRCAIHACTEVTARGGLCDRCRLDGAHELFHAEGLLQELDRAQLEGLAAGVDARCAGRYHSVRALAARLHVGEHFQTRAARQHQVGDHNIVTTLLECFVHIAGSRDRMTAARQQRRQGREGRCFVFDEQNRQRAAGGLRLGEGVGHGRACGAEVVSFLWTHALSS